jgi:hypothetical protein
MESHDGERRAEEERAVAKIKSNPKYFYSYVKRKSHVRSQVGPFVVDGDLISDPDQKCEALSAQFSSVFSQPRHAVEEYPGVEGEEEHAVHIDDVVLDHDCLAKSIDGLSASAAAGPDQIPAVLLKKCKSALLDPLCRLWRESVRTGDIPSALKRALITPIYKGGARDQPCNYRPVALTSHIIKVFEKVVVKQLTEYMESRDLHNRHQHGFRGGRSCLSQLLENHQRIVVAMEQGVAVDVVYLDFAKAFDKVDHSVVLDKLRRLGVGGVLLRWIRCFLIDRVQTVAVDGARSSDVNVVSGVPQGSVLGPLLFLVHVSDIDADLEHSFASSFADDTRLLARVTRVEDCERLQCDLRRIYGWAETNNMKLNGSKFELIRYGERDFAYDYQTGEDALIVCKNTVKDLGITVSDSGRFAEHMDEMVKRGRNKMGWILRTFQTREKILILTLYRSLVLPVLEYCCQLWCPQMVGEIGTVEAVQRTLTSKIEGLSGCDYWQRLEALGLYSLQRRRERYIIIYAWKVIHTLVPNLETHPIVTVRRIRRGRLCIVPKVSGRSLAGARRACEESFAVMGPTLFNCIPSTLRDYDGSLLGFKRKLDEFLKTVPDKPFLPHYYQRAAGNSLVQQLAQQRVEGSWSRDW